MIGFALKFIKYGSVTVITITWHKPGSIMLDFNTDSQSALVKITSYILPFGVWNL